MASSATRLDIYNMALGFIGTRTIGSPNESTPEAIQCNLMWDRARRSCLRDFPYNFAVRRALLPEKTLPDEYAVEYTNAYGTPNDNIRILKIFTEQYERLPYRIVIYNNAPMIVTTKEDVYCDYVCDEENIGVWDELFIMAMARKLACLIAAPLLKNTAELKVLDQLYQQAIPQAEGINSAEGKEERKKIDEWALPHWGGRY